MINALRLSALRYAFFLGGRGMKRVLFSILSFVVLSFVMLPSLPAEDLNDLAYRYRFLLKAGTILNSEGIGDCLLFPYYDVRREAGSSQATEINIENTGEYGIAAKLRVRDWSQGREVFSADIWIPSAGVWRGKIELAENGTNAKITSFDSVITSYDTSSFYLSQSLISTPLFSISKKKGKEPPPSGLYGYVEVIGEEKTAPSEINSVVGRLAASEQDCPNSLKGTAAIQRPEEGVSMAYEAVAIGNFSRGQGSLFRSPGSPYPLLSNGEDSLDQLEFQLSKWEIMGPYSLNQSIQEKTHLIITFPTKHFHYKNFSKRINKIDNPFKASNIKTGETLTTTVTSENPGQGVDSTIDLPFSVNVIGLYDYYSGTPTGIDNSGISSFYESGEVKLTSDHFAQRIMIQDFEYFQERFSTYRGLPSLGLILHEYRNPNLQATITPVEFSAVWEASDSESVFIPAPPSGPSFGSAGVSYTYSVGGSASSLGHPIQYFIDWGDGTNSGWLAVGTTSASKTWTIGGAYTVRAKARCSIHTDIASTWSDGLTVTIESVSPPTSLSGPTTGVPNQSYTYTAGGAVSSAGHPVEYQFDWKGDGTDLSFWGSGTQTKSWTTGGVYTVRARARCATHNDVVSEWTSGLIVTIELVSKPSKPTGPSSGDLGVIYTFSTGGAVSNLGHPVEYQFDWGDGTLSDWGPATRTHTWNNYADFKIKARARCVTHPTVVSDWSDALTFSIELITVPFIEDYAPPARGSIYITSDVITGRKGTAYSFGFHSAVSNLGHALEHQFDWGDGTFSQWGGPYIKAWPNSKPFPGYIIRVRARCVDHPSVVSDWSSGLEVLIDYITPPNIPSGPTSGTTDTAYTYSTGGSTSEIGQKIQYRFHWGDGTDSDWLPVDIVSVPKVWMIQGTYTIRTEARGWDFLGAAESTEHFSYYSPELSVKITKPVEESITTPNAPSGPSTGLPNTLYTYSTGGSVSSLGHSVQYFFDWGDGTDSNWLPVGTTSALKSWPAGGTYTVRVKARCATDTSAVSLWSVVLTVRIELISAPNTPIGPVTGFPGNTFTYMTGGAISNIGHDVEYQFDWKGDGSDLSAWGSTSRSKTWTAGGTYPVRARARCVTDTSIVSDWSSTLEVKIELITVSTPTGPTSVVVNTSGTYSATGSSNIGDPVQVRFVFSDGDDSGFLPVGTTTLQKTWTSGGSFTVFAQARCAIHTNNVSALSAPLAVTVNKLSQTITFGPLANKMYGDPPFDVSATASSGLPVSFSIVSGPATIAGNTVTITGTGTVTVKASQPGDANYSAAPDVTQSFTVNNPVPTTTSISPTTAKAGDPGFTLTVNGTNFVSSSVVTFNGFPRPTGFLSSTQLTATIFQGDIAVAGSFGITVFTPAPGGGTSNAQPLTVSP